MSVCGRATLPAALARTCLPLRLTDYHSAWYEQTVALQEHKCVSGQLGHDLRHQVSKSIQGEVGRFRLNTFLCNAIVMDIQWSVNTRLERQGIVFLRHGRYENQNASRAAA